MESALVRCQRLTAHGDGSASLGAAVGPAGLSKLRSLGALTTGSVVDVARVTGCSQSNAEVRSSHVAVVAAAQEGLVAGARAADTGHVLTRWGVRPFARAARWLRARAKLRATDLSLLEGLSPPLLREVAAVVASTGSLSRKELFESWEVATCVHAHFWRGERSCRIQHVTELAAGHSLVSWLLLLLAAEHGSPLPTATCVDLRMPRAAERLATAFVERWPMLRGRVEYTRGDLRCFPSSSDRQQHEQKPTLLAAVHACNTLTDAVIGRAITARCPVALLPCCHSLPSSRRSLPPLEGLTAAVLEASAARLGAASAIDGFRAEALRRANFRVAHATIPRELTDKNRLLMAAPEPGDRL